MREAFTSDRAPKAAGPYSPAIKAGGFVYCSGQGPLRPGTTEIVDGDIREQTRRVLENLKAVLEAAGSSPDRVLKCNVYLADMRNFAAMNEVYAGFFKAPHPARTTIQAGALPMGIAVEIDCIALV
ncbi:MAG TPA: RidA family protein [Planctomycetota bacterium]|jgi:2-iminobutanoate/2-iminopropanoate deaminase|nr:RidA family protein [Planctomycetota bacterium]